MKHSLSLVSSAFLILLLLMPTEMGPNPMVVEARACESQSHKFKGPCASKSNCAGICRTEGFRGGHCRGLRRRCFCTKPC